MSQSTNDGTTGRVATDLSESDRYRLLASDERRAVIAVLADEEEPVDLSDLAAAVAARADGVSGEREAKATLHHCHLPKLEAAAVVDYDADTRRVEASPSLPALLK